MYSSQELVNLMITGKATSNVFDHRKEIGYSTGGLNNVYLRGIDKPSEIGFLSLFEAYRHIEIGNYYKFPIYPVFVICSESHYSVLFLPPSEVKIEQKRYGGYGFGYYKNNETLEKDLVPKHIGSCESFDIIHYDFLEARGGDGYNPISISPPSYEEESRAVEAKEKSTVADIDDFAHPLELVLQTKYIAASFKWKKDPFR